MAFNVFIHVFFNFSMLLSCINVRNSLTCFKQIWISKVCIYIVCIMQDNQFNSNKAFRTKQKTKMAARESIPVSLSVIYCMFLVLTLSYSLYHHCMELYTIPGRRPAPYHSPNLFHIWGRMLLMNRW